jgi:hypothetical protein
MRTAESFDTWGLRLRKRLCVVMLTWVVGAQLAAQDKPDFSGRWVLESPSSSASDIPRALSVRQSVVRTTVRGEPMKPFFKEIAIDREFERGTRSDDMHHIGVAGGVVPGLRENGSANGSAAYHAVKWNGNALVFESGSYTGPTAATGVWAERREVWSLDQTGRLRLVITTRSSVAVSTTVTLLYRRP